MAKADNMKIFNALYTIMDGRYIRGQALTFTKSHDERLGPLMGIRRSGQRYGQPEPQVAFSDDPVKVSLTCVHLQCTMTQHLAIFGQDKSLLCAAFPSLAENLAPMAAAYGLEEMKMPTEMRKWNLNTHALIEGKLSPLLDLVDSDANASLVVGFDAEWNVSRAVGVSWIQLAPESVHEIYLIPVSHSTLCPYTSNRTDFFRYIK